MIAVWVSPTVESRRATEWNDSIVFSIVLVLRHFKFSAHCVHRLWSRCVDLRSCQSAWDDCENKPKKCVVCFCRDLSKSRGLFLVGITKSYANGHYSMIASYLWSISCSCDFRCKDSAKRWNVVGFSCTDIKVLCVVIMIWALIQARALSY